MPYEYRIKDQFGLYFVTFTVHQWVDVFTRDEYRNIIIQNLVYCQKEKGLLIYGWVLITNHIHLIVRSTKVPLSDIIRDFKKFTAKEIYKEIKNNVKESRQK